MIHTLPCVGESLKLTVLLISVVGLGGTWFREQSERADLRDEREEMVRTQLASPRWGPEASVRNPKVLEAFRQVPRDRFVPNEWTEYAYADRPLPIGDGQTISQPYMVAKMTELLNPHEHDRVLEIGTGSGYQAAILSQLVAEVYTIEIVERLAIAARSRLRELGYTNVTVRLGDGYLGWPEHAPFDGIVVTAGATEIPPALIEQLKPGGRMVIPVGENVESQALLLVTKGSQERANIQVQTMMFVRFVPLVRGPE